VSRSAATDWADLLRHIIELGTAERDLRTVLRRVAELVVEATSSDACFVHVVDREVNELVLMGATPASFDHLLGTIRLRVGEGLAGWTAAHREPSVVDDKWADPRYLYIPALRGEDYKSLVSVPMLRPEGEVVGVLNVHSREAGHFAEGDVARLRDVASLLAGIVENAVLYDSLAKRETELARFAAEMVQLQEMDRRQLANDIHDGISQRIVSAWYHLRAASALSNDPRVHGELGTTERLLSEALDEARGAIAGLRPVVLDDLGLSAAIASLAASLGGDVEVNLDLEQSRLPSHIETALYRIAQEALQNVVKHSAAQQVSVTLKQAAAGTRLEVTDDGRGFRATGELGDSSYGLVIMQERASLVGARVEIRSQPGAGTTVVVNVPSELYQDSQRPPEDRAGRAPFRPRP
jgi:signal transduction histidine kinase